MADGAREAVVRGSCFGLEAGHVLLDGDELAMTQKGSVVRSKGGLR